LKKSMLKPRIEKRILEAVKNNIIIVKDAKNRLLANALIDPLAMGEAETITRAQNRCSFHS
jgi:predicted nucleic acid-binding protein